MIEINIKHALQTMLSKYGTKMAHLMQYLMNLFETDETARVIIFSQWDLMLHEIGTTLTVCTLTKQEKKRRKEEKKIWRM